MGIEKKIKCEIIKLSDIGKVKYTIAGKVIEGIECMAKDTILFAPEHYLQLRREDMAWK